MGAYRIATPAVHDLDQIWVYYDRVAGEEVADRQLDSLYQRFLLLAEQPYMGVARPELDLVLRSHTVPHTRFIIFHIPRDYGVEIVRVVHGSRNLSQLFGVSL